MKRTIKDFVEDLISDGKSIAQIRTIAMNTYWKDRIKEVIMVAKHSKKEFKKFRKKSM